MVTLGTLYLITHLSSFLSRLLSAATRRLDSQASNCFNLVLASWATLCSRSSHCRGTRVLHGRVTCLIGERQCRYRAVFGIMAITAIPSFKSGTSVIHRGRNSLPVANSRLSCRTKCSPKLALPPGIQYVVPEFELEAPITYFR